MQRGLPEPVFDVVDSEGRRTALVLDPDGQPVELVIVPDATAEQLARIEVGLTVADLERSRAYYRTFVGLEELPPVEDRRFATRKYSYRHGATTISLRSFGKDLSADTGSGVCSSARSISFRFRIRSARESLSIFVATTWRATPRASRSRTCRCVILAS